MREQTSDLRIPRSDALPVSHRDSSVSKFHYDVHEWHASCMLLGSDNVDSVTFCKYIVNVPHGDSDFFSLSHARDRTKIVFLYFFNEL